jgi:hypothetical protein
MENLEKLATYGTLDHEKQKRNTICVGYHYTLTNRGYTRRRQTKQKHNTTTSAGHHST